MTFNRVKADTYNAMRLGIDWETQDGAITEAVALAQEKLGLEVDGKLGPMTERALLALRAVPDGKIAPPAVVAVPDGKKLTVDENGWLQGPGVEHVPTHPTWFDGPFDLPDHKPRGVVWHFTATNFGTGHNMARLHAKPYPQVKAEHEAWQDKRQREAEAAGKKYKREKLHVGSWHVTICRDGTLIQQIPFTRRAWHAGGPNKKALAGFGYANAQTVGIEQEGFGKEWPEEMIVAACRLAGALVTWAGIPAEYLTLGHHQFHTTKEDPGKLWYELVQPRILAHALGF